MTLRDFDFIGVENFAQFGRAIYKGVSCGPWIVAILPDGEEVYYEDEKARTITSDTEIVAVKVGSIVEGSDAEVPAVLVDDPCELVDTIEEINNQAKEMWEEANAEEVQ